MRQSEELRILKAVSAYFPTLLLREISSRTSFDPSKILFLSGGLLQADASGFTRMSEELSRVGREGAEELTGIFNRFFSVMLRIIFNRGGDVLKFGGDSLLVHFQGNHGSFRAVAAAVEMQQAMKRFRRISTSGGGFSLTLHVGIDTGEFNALSLGDPAEKLELAVLGENVNQTIRCNEAAGPGEIFLTENCLGKLERLVEVSEITNGFFKLLDLKRKPKVSAPSQAKQTKIKYPAKLLRALVPYLPRGIYDKIEADPGRSSTESEHRRITVLFLNLIYSDALLRDIGTRNKESCSVLNDHFKRVQEVVADYGGVISRIDPYSAGDKVLVLFGAPVAQEDDEERALLCALRIREKLVDLAEKLHRPVKYRIGINTGNAFCGEVGSATRKEYTVMGKDINLAARLMSKAGSGDILVGDQTFKAVSGRFSASEVSLKAKGISEAVTAFKVHRAEGRPSILTQTAPGRKKEVPLVGREKEVERISRTITQVLKRSGRILSITGEPGIGKSRLTEKLLELVSEKKMEGLLVNCQFYGSNTPLLPWTEILKSCCALLDSDDAPTRERKLAATLGRTDSARWAPLFNDLLGLSTPESEWTKSLDGEKRRGILFDTMVKLVLSQTAKGASYLILEDVHWIDQTSLDLLLYLSQRIVGCPFLLVLVHRPELRVQKLERMEHHEKIHLGELGRKEALKLASVHLGTVRLPDEMEKLIWEKSRGNPLYLQELIHSLRDSGHLVWNHSRKTYGLACGSGQINIPETVQDVIMSRIDKLDEIGRKIIKTASVIGRVFTFDTLASVLPFPLSEGELRRWLRYLDKLDLVPLKEIRPSVQYMFKHALTQEVAYNLLSFAQKKSLHLEIGDCYERKCKKALKENCELLAHHYERSPNLHKAFVYLIKAGSKGKRSYSNQEAIQFFDRAEKVYRQDRSSVRHKPQIKRASVLMSELLENRGEVYRLIGEYSRSEEDFLAMLNLAKRTKNSSRQSRSLNYLGELCWLRGDYRASEAHVERAHRISLSLKDDLGLAMSFNNFGDIHRRQGAFEKASECYRSSLKHFRRIKDKDGIVRAYNNIGISHWSLGALSEAADCFEKALQVRREVGDKVGEAKTSNNLALIYQDRGNLFKSLDLLTNALETFRGIGDKRNSGYCLGNMGTIYKSQADYSRAMKALQNSVEIFSEIGDQHALTYSIGNIGDVQLKMGCLEEARRSYDQTLSAAKTLEDEELESETLSRFGEYYFLRHELEESERYSKKALVLAGKIKSNEFIMKALAGLSEVQCKNGQSAAASKSAHRLLSLAEEENTREYVARGHLLSGMAKAATGRGPEAESNFKKALDISTEVGFREVAYRAHLELGRLYLDLTNVRGDELSISAEHQSSQARVMLQEITAGIGEPQLQKEFLRRRLADMNLSEEKSIAGRDR